MRMNLIDFAESDDISIEKAISYLKRNGWIKLPRNGNEYIWRKDLYWVFLPMNLDMADFVLRIKEVIQGVAAESGSSEMDIFRAFSGSAIAISLERILDHGQ